MASATAVKIASDLNREGTKLGDIKKRGREIKNDHDLAMELWSTGDFHPRLLSTLIFDKKLLSQPFIDQLATDMLDHEEDEGNQLTGWLLANQIMKGKKTVSMLSSCSGR